MTTDKHNPKWLTALRFLSGLILDSLYAFLFIAVGTAYTCSTLGVQVDQVIQPGGGQIYFLLGLAVFFVLIGQGISWLFAKLGGRGGDED